MRTFSLIFYLCLGLLFTGCSMVDYFRGGSNDELSGSQSRALQQRIEQLEYEIQDVRKDSRAEIVLAKEQIKLLQDRIKEFEGSLQDSADKSAVGAKAPEEKRTVSQKPVSSETQAHLDIKKLKIKVLSGTGDINSARRIASKLIKAGYEVKAVDFALRSNYQKDTVYFAKDYRKQAEHCVSTLGGGTVLKALTWPSAFHMIIVAGKNR